HSPTSPSRIPTCNGRTGAYPVVYGRLSNDRICPICVIGTVPDVDLSRRWSRRLSLGVRRKAVFTRAEEVKWRGGPSSLEGLGRSAARQRSISWPRTGRSRSPIAEAILHLGNLSNAALKLRYSIATRRGRWPPRSGRVPTF